MSSAIAEARVTKYALFNHGGSFPDNRVIGIGYEQTNAGRTVQATPVSLYPLGRNHPLGVVFGALENEPLWNDWIESIEEYRRDKDQSEDQDK